MYVCFVVADSHMHCFDLMTYALEFHFCDYMYNALIQISFSFGMVNR